MLEKTTAKDFSPFLNKMFNIYFDPSSPIALELIEVSEQGITSATSGRTSFSIVFRGSKVDVWPQGMYKVEHESLEEMILFLVPIGPDNLGQCYEAVFN